MDKERFQKELASIKLSAQNTIDKIDESDGLRIEALAGHDRNLAHLLMRGTLQRRAVCQDILDHIKSREEGTTGGKA